MAPRVTYGPEPVKVERGEDIIAKWYWRYLKEGLETKGALKEAQDTPKPSTMEPWKRGAANVSLQEGNTPNQLKREEMTRRSGEKVGAGGTTVSYVSSFKDIGLATLPKTFSEQIFTRGK